jgi:hypothetical protein
MQTSEFKLPILSQRVWYRNNLTRNVCTIGGILFLVLATAFVGLRTWKNVATPANNFDWQKRGMSDFYTMYYYSKAFGQGVNPYSQEIMERPEFVVPRSAAPFSPVVFLIDLPLTKLSVSSAMIVYFLLNWILLGSLAWLCLHMSHLKFDWSLWIWIFGFLVFSRPGHITLFTGYFTIQIVIGTLVAIHYSKTKPWLSAIGFAMATVKPTYAIPLGLLMLCRRDFKAVIFGSILSGILAVACLSWLASHSNFETVFEGIKSGQEAFHDDPTEEPANTWTRVDVAGLVAKVMHRVPDNKEYLATMLVLLVVPGLAVWKASAHENADRGVSSVSAIVVILAMLVTIYHHSYDCLLVCVSIIGLLLNRSRLFPRIPVRVLIFAGLLLMVPMLNYASTRAVRERLGFEQLDFTWQAITMVNGICLTVALVIMIGYAFDRKTTHAS